MSKSRRNPDATRRVWAERLDRFCRSGQTVAQFCAAEGVSEPSFYVWKRTLGVSPATSPAPAVVPIRLTPSPSLTGIEVALPSGAVVRFPAGIRPEMIVAVVRGLEGRPC
jgi:hypothetical protein